MITYRVIVGSAGKEMTKLTPVETKDKTLNAGFSMQGYDIAVSFEPRDDVHIKGNLIASLKPAV